MFKNLSLLFALLFAGKAFALEPCYFQGDYVKCYPSAGMFLNEGRSLLLGPDTNDTHYVELKADAAQTSNYTLTFPATNGLGNQSLLYDGSGGFSWYTPFTSSLFDSYKTVLPMKMGAYAASTGNLDITTNPGVVDGVDFLFGGFLLAKNQLDTTQNGLWRVPSSGAWTREDTMPDNMASAYSAIVPVNAGGTINGNTIWYSQSNGDGNVPFVQIPTTASNTPLTASRAITTDASGFLAPSTTTATELGYVHNVTSAIQTQLNAKITNPMTTQGDLLYENATPAPARLAAGTSTQLLHSGTTPSWSAVSLTADVTGTLGASNGGTGITSLGTGVATWLGTPSSANLAAAVTNETGTGALCFATSPTFTTSALFAGSSSGTTTLQATAAASGTLTLPATTDTLAVLGANTFTGNQIVSKASDATVTIDSTSTTGIADLLIRDGDNTTSARKTYVQLRSDETSPQSWIVGMNGSKDWHVENVTSGNTPISISTTTDGVGIRGTNTNDSASAGYVGEYSIQSRIQSNRAAVTTATPLNVTNSALSLTAGDWDISGAVCYLPNSTTNITRLMAVISKTSATIPGGDTVGIPTSGEIRIDQEYPASVPTAGDDICITIPPVRASISSTTSFFLVGQAAFTVSTLEVFGSIYARRVR
jgi:hypothetical protein